MSTLQTFFKPSRKSETDAFLHESRSDPYIVFLIQEYATCCPINVNAITGTERSPKAVSYVEIFRDTRVLWLTPVDYFSVFKSQIT